MAKQDLNKLQTRKMKGLKKGFGAEEDGGEDEEGGEADDGGRSRKKRKAE